MSNNLISLIPPGRNNSVSTAELAKLLQADQRTVRATISRLRRQGCIICSNSDSSIGRTGYFLPVSIEELETFVNIETARIKTHRAAIAPARKKLRALKGELS